jgi:hypothetical protein
MPRRSPDYRAIAVSKAREQPDQAFEKALWRLRRGMDADDAVIRAVELSSSRARDCMHGWLLATSKDDEISRRTRVPIDVIQAYRHLFFDVTVFRDHFDLVDWARGLSEMPDATPESNQYVRWAIMYGIEAVAYMSGLPVSLDPGMVQSQAMIDGHFKALMGREANLDSGTAREALKHQQMAVTQAAIIAKRSPGTDSVAIKLKHREMTSSIEFVDKTTEVLH